MHTPRDGVLTTWPKDQLLPGRPQLSVTPGASGPCLTPAAAPTQHSLGAGLAPGTVHPRVPTADRQWGRLQVPARGRPRAASPVPSPGPRPSREPGRGQDSLPDRQALGTETQGSAVLEELETKASSLQASLPSHIHLNIYMFRFTVLYMVILHQRSYLILRALQGGP